MKAFIPAKLAEVIFALIIAYFGYWHFTHADSMGKGVPDFIPGPGSLMDIYYRRCFCISRYGYSWLILKKHWPVIYWQQCY